MTPVPLLLSQDGGPLVVAAQKLGLILARTAGLFSIFPLGNDIFPGQVRVAAAIVVSLAIFPSVPQAAPGMFVLQLCAEGAVGLGAALLARIPLAAIEAGMQIASVSAGLGIASLLDPSSQEEIQALTEMVTYAALVIFFAVGGHHQLLLGLHESLQRVPPGGARISVDLFPVVLRLGGELFTGAVMLAAPIMLMALMLNLALALVSRAAPAVNIFSVALVVVLLCGLFAILRGLPGLTAAVHKAADDAARAFLLGFSS